MNGIISNPDRVAAKIAIIGAIIITEKPLYANAISPNKLKMITITLKSIIHFSSFLITLFLEQAAVQKYTMSNTLLFIY